MYAHDECIDEIKKKRLALAVSIGQFTYNFVDFY